MAKHRRGRGVAPGAVSDLDFAAWLEGRLPETAAARIEAAVAADPEMRRAALELADVLGKPLPAAPARLAVRAKALVGFEAEQQAVARRLVRLAVRLGPRFALQRAAMVTRRSSSPCPASCWAVASANRSPRSDMPSDDAARQLYHDSNELSDLFSDGI